MNQTSIRKKVSSLTLRMSLASVIVIGLLTIGGLLILRENMVKISGELGYTAAVDSQRALEERTIDNLETLAQKMAYLSDFSLMKIQNSVKMIAEGATEIVQNPEQFRPKPVEAPDAQNQGVMAAQFLRAEGTDMAVISEDAALMGNIQGLLLNIIHNNINVTTDYIASEKGYIIVVDEDSEMKTEFFDPRERPWYELAVRNRGLSWTDVYPDAYGRGLAITCAKPFFDREGQIAGVAGVGTLLDELKEIVIGAKVGETGYTFMLNEFGKVIISEYLKVDADGKILLEDLLNSDHAGLAEIAQNMVAGENGIGRVRIEDREYFIAYAALETIPWSLATLVGVDEAIAPALESGKAILLMKERALGDINLIIAIVLFAFVVIVFLITLFIAYSSKRFANTLTEPIMMLQEGVHRIADGNLEHRINIHSGDEIEELGQSVNKMALELDHHIADLQTVTAEKERISTELNVATHIQASMLPRIFPPFPHRSGFDIYATMEPAKEVGGDFYDFFLIDDRTLAVVMADVSDKGVPAALFMVIAKTLIKNSAQSGKSPKEVFETVNNMLCENNETDMFVTAFLGYLDILSGKLTFVNAGHNPPLLRTNGRFDWLEAEGGFVLACLDDMVYQQSEIALQPRDELFLYTDGVTEAVNRQGELFTDERLLERANHYLDLPLKEFALSIKREIDKFADGAEQADDIAMLVLRLVSGGQLSIEAKTENLDAVQEFIAKELEGADCPMELQMQIALAVEEIFVNIAYYAYFPEIGIVMIRVAVGDEVVIEFEDRGKPYNPLERDDPDIAVDAKEREVGGLGIFIVKNVMDQLEYRHVDGKNMVTMRKKV